MFGFVSFWLFVCVADCSLVATISESSVDLSGFVPLSSASPGSASSAELFNGSIGHGWHWKEDVNVSVQWNQLAWIYTVSYMDFLQTVREKSFGSVAAVADGTCIFPLACWCDSHPDFGATSQIFLERVENYHVFNITTSLSAWTLDISISSHSFVKNVTLNSSEASNSGELNVSAVVSPSTDCYANLSAVRMIALETNFSHVLFLASSWLGNQHNKLGYSMSAWVSDFNCSVYEGQLTMIPESGNGSVEWYTAQGWDLASLRADQMYAFKAGNYSTTLMEAILNSSSPLSNPNSCEILSHTLLGTGNETQTFNVFGSDFGFVNLTINLPKSMVQFSTSNPSLTPSANPSRSPTTTPTTGPSVHPSRHPTKIPTTTPSSVPSGSPSKAPSSLPTFHPTRKPSGPPTRSPTVFPSFPPTSFPTIFPSLSPVTTGPSDSPTNSPTSRPIPTSYPSIQPSRNPTHAPAPTLSFTAELYGSLFVSGITIEDVLSSYVSVIERSIASVLDISAPRVIISLVTPVQRRLLGRRLQTRIMEVHFTVKGYTATIDTLQTKLLTPSVANNLAASLSALVTGASFFDVSVNTETCLPGERLTSNGLTTMCVSFCSVDEIWDAESQLCVEPITQVYSPTKTVTAVNYIARSLYAALGAFAWGLCLLVINICKHFRR